MVFDQKSIPVSGPDGRGTSRTRASYSLQLNRIMLYDVTLRGQGSLRVLVTDFQVMSDQPARQ
jgi:hypothetical protein